MGIFKKIWHWLFAKKEVESYEDYKAKCLKDAPVTYNTGGYIKNAERYVAPRYYSEATSNNTVINQVNEVTTAEPATTTTQNYINTRGGYYSTTYFDDYHQGQNPHQHLYRS